MLTTCISVFLRFPNMAIVARFYVYITTSEVARIQLSKRGYQCIALFDSICTPNLGYLPKYINIYSAFS